MEITKNDIVKLAVDTYANRIEGNYSIAEGCSRIQKAIFDIVGITGTEKISPKALRRNDNLNKVFEILETVIPAVAEEGLKGDEFFMNLVEEINIGEGDKNEFVVDEDSYFVVSTIANGIATPRRQRIGKKRTVSVETSTHAIRFYEEMTRLLSGRVDWSDFMTACVKAYTQEKYNLIYSTFSGITSSTAGLNNTYVPVAGTFNEDTLLDIIEHVEAATGKDALIVGTRKALRKVKTAVVSDEAKSDIYNLGYYGKFEGTPMVRIKNRHAQGTDKFIIDDSKLYIIASDDRPIKFVTEGDGFIDEKSFTNNADLTQEYVYLETYGAGLVINGKIGVYELT